MTDSPALAQKIASIAGVLADHTITEAANGGAECECGGWSGPWSALEPERHQARMIDMRVCDSCGDAVPEGWTIADDHHNCNHADDHPGFGVEGCAACNGVTKRTQVQPTDDLALCQRHWSAWIIRYLGSDDAPCNAHALEASSQPTEGATNG